MNVLMAVVTFARDVLVPVVIFVVLPVWFWYQRDRRKSQAETAVAERTVGVDVNAREAGGLGAAVAFVQEAFRVERESKDREILNLTEKVAKLEIERSRDKAKIEALEQAEEEKDQLIFQLRVEVQALTRRLTALEAVSPPTDPNLRAVHGND